MTVLCKYGDSFDGEMKPAFCKLSSDHQCMRGIFLTGVGREPERCCGKGGQAKTKDGAGPIENSGDFSQVPENKWRSIFWDSSKEYPDHD